MYTLSLKTNNYKYGVMICRIECFFGIHVKIEKWRNMHLYAKIPQLSRKFYLSLIRQAKNLKGLKYETQSSSYTCGCTLKKRYSYRVGHFGELRYFLQRKVQT